MRHKFLEDARPDDGGGAIAHPRRFTKREGYFSCKPLTIMMVLQRVDKVGPLVGSRWGDGR